jgi:hypothetical protein
VQRLAYAVCVAHHGLLPCPLLVKMPHGVMIITPFDFCRAASTLYGDIEGEDLDISRPKSVSIRASCLENALTRVAGKLV